jgi:molecular chaperone GrpE
MPQRKDQNPETEQETPEAAPEEIDQVEETADAPDGPADEAPQLAAEAASLKDQLLRALAETENLRRRSRRELEDAVKYAAAPVIKDLLAVADNLRRALDSVPDGAAEEHEQLKTLIAGIELTEKELNAVFERHGIVKIEPLGERLDPHFHEAMYEIPDPASPNGTVLRVIQAGYRLRDRLLRPAQVGVAKGGPAPKAVADEPAASEDDSADSAAEETDTAGDAAADAGQANGQAKPGSRFDTTA